MTDILRIHVVWAAGSDGGARVAELISRHFDGIGMERDGVAYRVPVRFASAPWNQGKHLPAPVDLSRAEHNAVVLLHDDIMAERVDDWDGYVERLRAAMAARGSVDFVIPFGSPSGDPVVPSEAKLRMQYAQRRRWAAAGMSRDACDSRLLLHTLYQIRRHLALLSGGEGHERIFVSHAKADGDATASAIVDFVNSRDQDVPLHTFYDAKELNPGEDFSDQFKDEIAGGTLLAIVSDVYDSRPWCVFELTTAKRGRRPIVLADIGEMRTNRTFPYGANLPKVRIRPAAGGAWIEPLLVETLSEGLRCDLFDRQARRVVADQGEALTLPRPPELFDLVDAERLPRLIVYPDPPVGAIEEKLLQRALAVLSPETRLLTLGELS